MSGEFLNRTEIPYIPFPKNPERTKFLDFEAFKYISPTEMDKFVKALSDRNKLTDYDEILVNMWGGWELFKDLRKLQGYRKWPKTCEFHRFDGTTISVDPHLKNKKVLIVDDSLERGWTMQKILRLVGPESRAVVAVTLKDVPEQVVDPRIDTAVILDNLKLGGKGIDIGVKGEGQIFRQYRGVVAIC